MHPTTTPPALSRSALSLLRSFNGPSACIRQLPVPVPPSSIGAASQCRSFSSFKSTRPLPRQRITPPSPIRPIAAEIIRSSPVRDGLARYLSTTAALRALQDSKGKSSVPMVPKLETQEPEGFEKSEKATRAAQVNLSARLHKEGPAVAGKAGFGEILRLLKIARPEAKWLAGGLSAVSTQQRERCALRDHGHLLSYRDE